MTPLETGIRELTKPIGGQYPRPWMTKMKQPENASIFIVGRNQAKTFLSKTVGSHDRFIDALWNRNGLTCRSMYDDVIDGGPSPTRGHIDEMTLALEAAGMNDVLETNVICFSSRMSAELESMPAEKLRGSTIFEFLVRTIMPKILLVHGMAACKDCGKALGHEPKSSEWEIEVREVGSMQLLLVPSLAAPRFRRAWWDDNRDAVVSMVSGFARG